MSETAEELRQVIGAIEEMETVLEFYKARRSELCKALYDSGEADLGDVKIVRTVKTESDVAKAKDLIPAIYDDIVQKMVETYRPVPTLTQLKEAIAHLSEEQQQEILERISKGEPTESFSIRRRKQ